jgi:hypothetical protein
LRREEHAGDGVIGASQDQKLQGDESVCARSSKHTANLGARHWRNLGGALAPEKGFESPIREEAVHGESRPRKGTSNRDGINSIPFVLQLARRFCCPRQKAFFFVLPPEWALVSAGQQHAFVCVEPLLAHRIGVTQPGVCLMG